MEFSSLMDTIYFLQVYIRNIFRKMSRHSHNTHLDKEAFAINYLQCWLLLREKQIKTEKTLFCNEGKMFNSTTDVTLNAYLLASLGIT